MIPRPTRSTLLTHSLPTRRSSDRQDRQQERDSERQYEMHDQRQIVAHGRQRLLRQAPGISLKTQEEMKRRGHDDEIGERRAHREKHRGGQQKRQEGALFISIQARSDEQPYMVGDHRKRQHEGGEQHTLNLDEKRLVQLGVHKDRKSVV